MGNQASALRLELGIAEDHLAEAFGGVSDSRARDVATITSCYGTVSVAHDEVVRWLVETADLTKVQSQRFARDGLHGAPESIDSATSLV